MSNGDKPRDPAIEYVTISIDDKEISVPKGTNVVDAAGVAGVEIPHYCYHPHLSIAGNCRMCQVEINGAPKLGIACNTTAAEGLKIRTHVSSVAVAEAQRATLEFLLINHPLDCTVCDAAGHCKLQDYYYEYDAKGSRYIEPKTEKVKAEPLGPEVIYDGERCIMCTRCVRFCDEITETSELGAYNRGDRGVIGIANGHELNNPLSGTVVDLCPVGALTHREWRFNSRIWYSDQMDSLCTGCSTGCNAKVAVRDDRVVYVKARLNSSVNKEWMCDEGRYGFERFQPANRLTQAMLTRDGVRHSVKLPDAFTAALSLKNHQPGEVAVFLSPTLTLEEVWFSLLFSEQVLGMKPGAETIAMQLRSRPLNPVEALLVSPDYAANARAITLFDENLAGDDWRKLVENRYDRLLDKLRNGLIRGILLIGDGAISNRDCDSRLLQAISGLVTSVALTTETPDIAGEMTTANPADVCKILLPGRTVNEKSGVLVNRDLRLQRLKTLLSAPFGTMNEWLLLAKLANAAGKELIPRDAADDRRLFSEMVKRVPSFAGLTLQRIGEQGINLRDIAAAPESEQRSVA